MPQIHIGRGTTNLGVYELEEIKAGLVAGRFLLTDLGWKEGMPNWKPLSEFPELAEAPTHEPVDTQLPDFSEPTDSEKILELGNEEGLPWEQRKEIGWLQAYLQTAKLVLVEPARAFAAMRKEGGIWEPLLFSLIGGVIGGIFQMIYLQKTLQDPSFLQQIQHLPPQFRDIFATQIGMGAILAYPFTFTATLFIFAGLAHLCLLLVGGARRGFETTFRVICYCIGATNPLLAIPFCGGLIAQVWGLIVEVIGLAKAHEIQTSRALTAVLLPVICCCSFLFAAFIALAATQMGQ